MLVLSYLLLIPVLSATHGSQTVSLLTQNLLVRKGDTATLIGSASSTVLPGQINWEFNGVPIVQNGAVVKPTGKYLITLNNVTFTLTIIKVSSEDYGVYTLNFFRLPTVSLINATIGELVIGAGTFCSNSRTFIATCVFLVVGFTLLIITICVLYFITQSDSFEIKRKEIIILLFIIPTSTAFHVAMITIWGSFNNTAEPRNSTGSVLGLVSYVLIWIGILYFTYLNKQKSSLKSLYFYITIGFSLFQIGMLIGIVLCISNCASQISLPYIDIDYGLLGVLFAVLAFIASLIFFSFYLGLITSQRFQLCFDGIFSKYPEVIRIDRETCISPDNPIKGNNKEIERKPKKFIRITSGKGVKMNAILPHSSIRAQSAKIPKDETIQNIARPRSDHIRQSQTSEIKEEETEEIKDAEKPITTNSNNPTTSNGNSDNSSNEQPKLATEQSILLPPNPPPSPSQSAL